MTEQINDQTVHHLQPLVTVAMPVFNGGQFLRPAVLSIINQTFRNWELLIIDDGSTDNAIDTLADIKDDRIKIFRDSANKGIAFRLNQAIDLAQGDFFARIDSDDTSYPQRFELQLAAFKANSNLDLVATRAEIIDAESKVTGQLPFVSSHKQICAKPWRGFYMPHPSWFGKLQWFKTHKYAIPAPYYCEDQELLLRAYKHSEFVCLNETLIQYRSRNKINLVKSIKTRWALFKFQLKFFGFSQPVFSVFAIVLLVSRVIKDVFIKLVETFK